MDDKYSLRDGEGHIVDICVKKKKRKNKGEKVSELVQVFKSRVTLKDSKLC